MKTNQNINFRRGDHKQIIFDVTLSDNIESLVDVEKIYWYVSKSFATGETFKSNDSILEKEKVDMTVETNIIKIDLATTETQLIEIGVYYHELKIEDSSGNISTLARGKFRLY